MAPPNEYMRRASPNEQRTICREDLGFYQAVIVSAVYEFGYDVDLTAKETFFHPLKTCIQQHPWLCVAVGDKHTDKSYYERVPEVVLADYITVCEPVGNGDELASISRTLEADLDEPFPAGLPPWRILVLPLTINKCLVAFSYSHTIGDGITGKSFHQFFLNALRMDTQSHDQPPAIVRTSNQPLPPPFDTPERLPISWSFLLRPLVAVLVPKFIGDLLGLQSSASTPNAGTWTPTPMFFDPETLHSRLRAVEISCSHVERALNEARAHDAKLTGTLQQLIVRALSKNLPGKDITNFISMTAINMRGSVGIPQTEMGEFASGCFVTHPRSNASGPFTNEEWADAKESTRRYASSAAQLQDQPIALLRYAPSIRNWTASKIGGRRDCSWELSNIGNFEDVKTGSSHSKVSITKMVFAQPGHVMGPCICFNFSTVKGQSLTCTATWQAGSLGVDGDEGAFVDDVCKTLKEEFASL